MNKFLALSLTAVLLWFVSANINQGYAAISGLTSPVGSSDVNWSSVNANAQLNSGGVNWSSINENALFNTGGVNWSSINTTTTINSGGVNWSNIIVAQQSRTGVNWQAVDTSGGGINWISLAGQAGQGQIMCWNMTAGRPGKCVTSVAGTGCTTCN